MSLAENMRIKMEDGSMKEINAVKIGDRICNEENGSVVVTSVFNGMEEFIYCIKLNMRISATSGH